ncbi:MAG: hypothetical protein WAM60_18080 [Candidatus Promineifilaceae bacterium]
MENDWVRVGGIIEQGHQIASGRSPDSPYPAGSIPLQKPFFEALGLDLSGFFDGTLNVSIRPYTFTFTNPQYTFRQVHWMAGFRPEDFSFSHCKLLFDGRTYDGWVYYPHPETKIQHFQKPSILEIIVPLVPKIAYGDMVEVMLDEGEITLSGRD